MFKVRQKSTCERVLWNMSGKESTWRYDLKKIDFFQSEKISQIDWINSFYIMIFIIVFANTIFNTDRIYEEK